MSKWSWLRGVGVGMAVGKAIRRAVHHIAKANRTLGEHLNNAVRTGARCSYQP